MATFQVYGMFGANALGGDASGDAGQMDLLSDTLKMTLHTSTYTPNIDTHEAFSSATNELSTANGYTANGVTLTTKTLTYNATGNISTFVCDDISWTASGGSLVFQYAVLHDDTVSTGPPVKPLIGYIDCGAQTITTGNTFTLDVTASGLFTVTVT
jgi:hypothetical protein